MSLARLPTEILIIIVSSHLPQRTSASDYLRLRLLNRKFDDIVLHALFDLDIGRRYFPRHFKELARSEYFVYRFWRARFRHPTFAKCPNYVVTETPRGSQLSAANDHHVEHIQSALRSAIQHLSSNPTYGSAALLEAPCDLRSADLVQASLADQIIHVLCKATMCIYGVHQTWTLLGANVEEDVFQWYMRLQNGFMSLHHADTWLLHAAVYLNDITSVKAILEPIRFIPKDRSDWRRQLSTTYFLFAFPYIRDNRTGGALRNPPPAARDEQRWIRLTSSAFIVAASVGHVDIISYLLRLEPYIMRKAFRTQSYFAAGNNAMTAAIANNQLKVFELLCRHRWPLVTRTGFTRKEYFSALETALIHASHGVGAGSILAQLLDMSSDWKSPYFLERMLHMAAIQNNLDLVTIVLDRLVDERARMFSNHWSTTDQPRCIISIRPFNFALGTAAHLGHAECVERFLTYQGRSLEAGVNATECAIHAVLCHTKVIAQSHLIVLEQLLRHTSGVLLEDIVTRAAYRHGESVMAVFTANVDLSQREHSLWDTDPPRYRCKSTNMDNPGILDPQTQPLLGEIALAAALKGHNFQSARTLVKYHNVTLEEYFVPTEMPATHKAMEELYELQEIMLGRGMVVEEITDYKVQGESDQEVKLGLIFRPVSDCDSESTPREFQIRHPHDCAL